MLSTVRNWPSGWKTGLVQDYLRSLFLSYDPRLFSSVHTYCMFLGHSRSGHSLLASLLDAHRHVVIADEIHSVRYAAAGFHRDRIYGLILRNSEQIAKNARERAGYEFLVSGQWQGRYEEIRVMGDKDGSFTGTMAVRNFLVIESTFKTFSEQLRFLHVFRNPFDVISTIYLRLTKHNNTATLDHAISYFFKRQEGIDSVRQRASWQVKDLKYEDFMASPEASLKDVCTFIGVDCPEEYSKACTGIVFGEPRRTRENVKWTDREIDQVIRSTRKVEYLRNYTFE